MKYMRPLILIIALTGALFISRKGFSSSDISLPPVPPEQTAPLKLATFAGGCFWCMEKPFDHVKGVVKTISGYTGGHKDNPTYSEVSAGVTGHREALQVTYDPQQVSYAELLDVFWHNVDPLNSRGQFCDNGVQYTTAIFYHDDEQRAAAEKSLAELKESKKFAKPIVTAIEAAATFYPAEDYHQDYYQKNPVRYKFYRYNCGRDNRLEELWGEK